MQNAFCFQVKVVVPVITSSFYSGHGSQQLVEVPADVRGLGGSALDQAGPHLIQQRLAQAGVRLVHAAAGLAQHAPQQGQRLLLHQLGPAGVQLRHQLWEGGGEGPGESCPLDWPCRRTSDESPEGRRAWIN